MAVSASFPASNYCGKMKRSENILKQEMTGDHPEKGATVEFSFQFPDQFEVCQSNNWLRVDGISFLIPLGGKKKTKPSPAHLELSAMRLSKTQTPVRPSRLFALLHFVITSVMHRRWRTMSPMGRCDSLDKCHFLPAAV